MKLTKDVRDAFKRMGKRGGKARAASLTKEQRVAIAKLGAAARWPVKSEKAS